MEPTEPDRRVETADFAPVRIAAGAGRREAWLTAAWILAFLAAVGIGLVGRSLADAAASGPPAGVAAAGVASAGATTVDRGLHRPATSPDVAGPLRADDPEPLAVTVKATNSGISITGTVLVRLVTTISIDVVGVKGEPLAVRSIAVGDPDGGIRPGTQPAFSIRIDLPASAMTSVAFVELDAADGLGDTIGSTLQWLGPPLADCGVGRNCTG